MNDFVSSKKIILEFKNFLKMIFNSVNQTASFYASKRIGEIEVKKYNDDYFGGDT